MNEFRRHWHYSLLLAFCCLLMSCTENSDQKAEQVDVNSGDKKPRIALIMKSLANDFFSSMAEGAKKHQQQQGDEYELIVNGIKDERDLSRQVALVEEMVANGVDAIVIAPADSKALVPALRRAREAGVVVVNIDNKLDQEILEAEKISIPFVGPDNQAGAKKVGDFLASKLKSGDEVVVLEGIRTSFNGTQRRLGFEAAMQDAGIKIVDSQSAQWEMSMANTLALSMLSEHPNVKAILAANDSMALGALAAVKNNNKTGEVAIVGFDNIAAVQQAIRDGQILATADQHGGELAVFGIEHALRLIEDPDAKVEDRETPVDLITAEVLK
ncbi:sugar ABC transporter substrate-binding protein [Gimesia aquarii]|uniref:D-allose-binding periplasmic protein n=1 Tax=Gimesia aquarii TaxID=2527964 RepID=A0A517VZ21_9PLAN|nr:sugar ABC transporter substrate-binding protein [Gimesia aquarii]QDT98251.1 D-allose-binding periplasmic protein precursor [Gimesia aquarii]